MYINVQHLNKNIFVFLIALLGCAVIDKKMPSKISCESCKKLFCCKTALNQHVMKFHGSAVHQRWLLKNDRSKTDQARNFLLKLWGVAEKSD